MRVMMIVKGNAESETGVMPTEKLLSEMGEYNDQLIKAGAMLAGEGLAESSQGTRVRLSGRKFTVTDGPFAEAKELVAGFWIIQTKSMAEAIDWAKRVPCEEGGEGDLELRPLFETEDFPVDAKEDPEGWRKQELAFREAPPPAAKEPAPGARFMLMIKSDKHTESDAMPNQETLTAMGALMNELVVKGAMLGGEGLKPSKHGKRVKFQGKQRTVVDGPFAEAKELIGGYCIVRLPSKAEAIDFAKRWLQIHVDGAAGLTEAEIEIRRLHELEDFPVDPAEKPDGWRKREADFRNSTR